MQQNKKTNRIMTFDSQFKNKRMLKKLIVFCITICTSVTMLGQSNSTVLMNGVRVNSDGVIWAMSNVGSPGTFVLNPEDFGHYYTYDQAKNVCPQGWRLPTDGELQNLINSGSKWTNRNGTKGRVFGRYSNAIFLPAANYQGYMDGSYGTVAGGGGYWSSTDFSGEAVVMGLYFAKKYASLNFNHRSCKQSVRCVAK